MKSQDKGIKRIIKAFGYSYNGFKSSLKSEAALRQEVILCTFGFCYIFIFSQIENVEKLLLSVSLFIILMAELINTAIETIIDRISPDYHELSKKAKDIGSFLVLLSFINAFIVWIGILYDKWRF